jgi:hypothetical protein
MIRRFAWPSGYVLFFGLFSCYKRGDGSPDFLNYHLYNGYAAVTGGRPQDIAAAGMQSYFYPGLDALYYRLFGALNDHPLILEFLLGLPYALAAWLVWRVGCKVLPDDWPGRESLAGAFALFGMTGAAGFATIGTTMSEVVPSLPMLAALMIWVEHRGNWRWLGVVGALAGLSVALKLTLLPSFVALLVVVALAEVRRPIAALRAALIFGGTGLVAALVVAGPWLLHNWQFAGNPIFPNYNDVFRSDLVDHGRWSDDRFKPHGLWRVLFYPAVWAFHPSNAAIELNTRDPRMLMALVAAVALVVRRGANTAARLLALFVLLAYVLWEYQFSILRYLAVQEALSGVLVLAAVAAWVPRRHALPAGIALVVIAGTAAATTRYPWWSHASRADQAIVVHVPSIPQDALVLLLDASPWSYIVPSLPPSVTVVGTNNNMVRPGVYGTLQQEIERTVRDWKGPIWGFESSHYYPGDADKILAHYRLRREAPCADITSNVDTSTSTACQLQRVP